MARRNDVYFNEYQKNLAAQQNVKYKKKYRKLKQIVKDTVFENAALCDQVSQMQENLLAVKEERLYLLRKLYQLQGEVEPGNAMTKMNASHSNSHNNPDGTTGKKAPKKKASVDSQEPKNKSKRATKTTRKVVQLIPLDLHGRPIFPIKLGNLTVYSLGEVVSDRITYHTEDLIYPVGYCSTRIYASLRDPSTKSLYTCKILDGGLKPRFEIVSDNDINQPLVGSTPDECHSRLLAAISPNLCSIIPKGAEFFGISHPTIQNLIQSSPGTRKLVMYKPLKFEVSKNQSNDQDLNSIDEEMDPGLGFKALHRKYQLPSNYLHPKVEPADHDLLALRELLA